MTVGDLKRLLEDPMLSEDSEVRIGIKDSLDGCTCACCCDDVDVGVIGGVVGKQTGQRRALVLQPEENLFESVPQTAGEEED